MRLRGVLLTAAFVSGLALGCVDRLAGVDDMEIEEKPACLWVWGYGTWDDGTMHALVNEDGLGETACMCLTEDEQYDLLVGDKQAFIDHELNGLAFDLCVAVAEPYDFDWDPCQETYESGEWRNSLSFVSDDPDYDGPRNWDGLTCGDAIGGGEVSCALSGQQPSLTWLVVLAGLVGLRRRRGASLEPLRRCLSPR